MKGGVRACLLGLALSLAALPAAAETAGPPTEAELAAARVLFVEARELEKQGRWEEALARLESVAKVRMTPQVRFHIALCQKQIGKLVAARNGFEQARREARKGDAEQVLRESEEHIADLESRIPTLHIHLVDPPAAVTVLIDGDAIEPGLLAVPIPLDPGEHRVRAEADGRRAFEHTLSLEQGEKKEISVSLPVLAPEPPAPKAAPVAPPKPRPRAPRTDEEPPTAGWVLIGTGGALLVGAVVSAVVRSSAIDEIDESCPSHTNCDPSLEETRDRAQTYGTLGVVLGGLGAVTAGTGAVLVWSSGDGEGDGAQVAVRPVARPEGFGMAGVLRW